MAEKLSLLQQAITESIVSNSAFGMLLECVPGGRLRREEAVRVYQTAYISRLTEALGETFEGVWSVLGDEQFFLVCKEFIRKNESTSHNISDYGVNFPNYLEGMPETRTFPFLPELAAFEWDFKTLFHSKEHEHADLSAEHSLGPDTRLRFGSAVRLFRFKYTVLDIWKARAVRRTEQFELDWSRKQNVAAYKLAGEIYCREFDDAQFSVLESLEKGRSLKEAVERACELAPNLEEARIRVVFQFIGESGIVSLRS